MRYFLITLGVIILILFGIVIFNRGSSRQPATPGKKVISLLDYSKDTNASVQFTVEGPINALENHRTTVINVAPNSRTLTIYTGYQGEALLSKTYSNDVDSYIAFLNALNHASFLREQRVGVGVNPASICPTANRNHYQLIQSGKDVVNLWSASCAAGSFGGNVPLTTTLFQAQIPNYSTTISSVPAAGN